MAGIDIANLKLGKKPARFDSRTLRLSKYLADVPSPPEECDWTSDITQFGAMLNNDLGDCTIAAMGHAIQCWTAVTGNECTVPDPAILQAYEQWTGYDPADPSTDQGAVELDVLKKWRQRGLGYPGVIHGLHAFAAINPANDQHVKQAITLFGGVYIGVELPVTAQGQVGGLWDVAGDPNSDPDSMPGSWGGHAMWFPRYQAGRKTGITWGALQDVSDAFWNTYVSEVYGLIPSGNDWVLPGGDTIMGFSLAKLDADLQAL